MVNSSYIFKYKKEINVSRFRLFVSYQITPSLIFARSIKGSPNPPIHGIVEICVFCREGLDQQKSLGCSRPLFYLDKQHVTVAVGPVKSCKLFSECYTIKAKVPRRLTFMQANAC